MQNNTLYLSGPTMSQLCLSPIRLGSYYTSQTAVVTAPLTPEGSLSPVLIGPTIIPKGAGLFLTPAHLGSLGQRDTCEPLLRRAGLSKAQRAASSEKPSVTSELCGFR